MKKRNGDKSRLSASRRGFLSAGAGLIATAGAGLGARGALAAATPAVPRPINAEAFWGEHQGGIATPAQSHTYFAAFDLTTGKRTDVAALLQAWTVAAARMAAGKTAQPIGGEFAPVAAPGAPASSAQNYASYQPASLTGVAADSGEALGLEAARLTVTFGFGPGLFIRDNKDRYGLAAARPAALVDMPSFVGDQLVEGQTGGDLSVQACADDPQIAFHAVRQLARLAENVAKVRWVQTGFMANFAAGTTPRNLMGFKDGTVNPPIGDPKAMAEFVWVGEEGPVWMRRGSYLIVRRIRIALEHWDRMKTAFQEQTVGRQKYSGAPLGKKNEFDALDLNAVDKDGNPVIPENAHVRLASAANNGGAQFLRRPYSYNDGVDFVAERWPPWRQGLEYDAGLLFVAYQRDPRTGFIKIFDKVSKLDMMNQFVTHVGGGIFACPGGLREGGYIGQALFEA